MPPLQPSDQRSVLENTAIRFLSFRPRFKAEVVNRLAKKATELGMGDPLTLINQIIISLEKSGFINDPENLKSFICHRLETKLKGPYWIKSRLLQLGLTRNEIETGLREFAGRQVQLSVISRFLGKKLTGKSPDPKSKAKLFRSLANRGFSYPLIAEAFDGRVHEKV